MRIKYVQEISWNCQVSTRFPQSNIQYSHGTIIPIASWAIPQEESVSSQFVDLTFRISLWERGDDLCHWTDFLMWLRVRCLENLKFAKNFTTVWHFEKNLENSPSNWICLSSSSEHFLSVLLEDTVVWLVILCKLPVYLALPKFQNLQSGVRKIKILSHQKYKHQGRVIYLSLVDQVMRHNLLGLTSQEDVGGVIETQKNNLANDACPERRITPRRVIKQQKSLVFRLTKHRQIAF